MPISNIINAPVLFIYGSHLALPFRNNRFTMTIMDPRMGRTALNENSTTVIGSSRFIGSIDRYSVECVILIGRANDMFVYTAQ